MNILIENWFIKNKIKLIQSIESEFKKFYFEILNVFIKAIYQKILIFFYYIYIYMYIYVILYTTINKENFFLLGTYLTFFIKIVVRHIDT